MYAIFIWCECVVPWYLDCTCLIKNPLYMHISEQPMRCGWHHIGGRYWGPLLSFTHLFLYVSEWVLSRITMRCNVSKFPVKCDQLTIYGTILSCYLIFHQLSGAEGGACQSLRAQSTTMCTCMIEAFILSNRWSKDWKTHQPCVTIKPTA